ncbi:glutathione S-transferase E14 [Lucilia sericata]|uniref:glutathione S-transferase E14 n=1 Tax=Lucilia sericata TaxID=13632 RepID=UPI0018A86A61|nr:glutathione S-transferase E14 [Lucilia sericata]
MKPVLYYDQRSPPVRSVLMLLKVLNIEVDLKFIDLFKGEQLKPTFKELNPAHTVPTLVDDDLVLTDSHVILMHLCEKYQKSDLNLWPRQYKERMQVTNMLLFEASLIFRRDSEMMSEIVRKTYANVDIPYHQRKMHEIYDMCEVHLKKHKYLATDYLTIADISIVSTVAALNLVFPIDYEKFSNLYDWLQRLKKMEFYQYNEEGIQKLRYLLEKVGKFPFPSPFRNKQTSSESDSDTSDLEENKKSDEENKIENDIIINDKELEVHNRRVSDSRNVNQSYKADKSTSTESLAELFAENESVDFDPEKLNFKNYIGPQKENENNNHANNYTICWDNVYRSCEFEENIHCGCCLQTPINAKDLKSVKGYPLIDMESCICLKYNTDN